MSRRYLTPRFRYRGLPIIQRKIMSYLCLFFLVGCTSLGTITFQGNRQTLLPVTSGIVFAEGYSGIRQSYFWVESVNDIQVDVNKIKDDTVKFIQDRHWNYDDFKTEIILSNGVCLSQKDKQTNCDLEISWDRFSNTDKSTMTFSLSIRYHLVVINNQIENLFVENLYFRGVKKSENKWVK
jgi:hypothetical protein